jgi:predicted cupin superfamily sugar epimerase
VKAIDKVDLIRQLKLQPHTEGGYFRRTFQADHRRPVKVDDEDRYTMTAIYYLLTDDSPVGHWHMNRSDILHFFHLGAPVRYFLIHPDGVMQTVTLGPDLHRGQVLQLPVKGGVWKASQLSAGEFGLISEAVAPGFDSADNQIGERASMEAWFPDHEQLIRTFTRA